MKPPPIENDCVSVSDDITDLTRIFEARRQVSVWQRAEPERVAHYLQSAVISGNIGPGFAATLRAGSIPIFPELPDSPLRNAFLMDLRFITGMYFDLLGCPQIGLRVEMLSQAMCPRFHVDRTGIRMLCTYRGPGTEWLADHAADRSRLGPLSAGMPDETSGLILDPAAIGSAPPFSIVLLKGSLWQGNAGRGAIHRSPAIPAREIPRILVALDAIW